MRMEEGKRKGHHLSARRVLATAVALGCHIVMLMALLRPAEPANDKPVRLENRGSVLKARFISKPSATPMVGASMTSRSVGSSKASMKARVPPPVQHVARRATPAYQSAVTNAPLPAAISVSPAADAPDTNDHSLAEDGGFRDRMSDAQNAQRIRGVPGTDRRVAPGIDLTAPMDQGIGSVMRNAQRLFGVPNRHCIDVDVWRHLSPDQLKDRHLTAADVERESDKYQCNRPPGLNF
jgi:hypothetical protein